MQKFPKTRNLHLLQFQTKFCLRTDLIIPNLEAAWVEVNLCNKKVLIGSFYIHPRFSDWGLVEVAIEQASQVCTNLILLGDFNQDMFIARKSQEIRGIMNMFGLKQIIDNPTRVTPYSSTLIDLILVSDSLSCTDRGTLEPFCSDHHAVYFSTNFMNLKSNFYIRKIWQYDNADFDLFRQKLQDCNWNIQNKNIGDQIRCIAENITQSAEQSIPNKIVTIMPRDLPWFHNGIRRSIRNRLHGIAKRLNNPDNWQRFRDARNKVTSEIGNAKVNYFKKNWPQIYTREIYQLSNGGK